MKIALPSSSGRYNAIAPEKNYRNIWLFGLTLLLLLMAGTAFRSFAQAPTLSYSGPQTYTAGQTITPLAPTSSGVSAYGYGSPATLASGFTDIMFEAGDAAGNVYVGDGVQYYPTSNYVYKVSATGVKTNLFPFSNGLNGLGVDPSGTYLYFTDQVTGINRVNASNGGGYTKILSINYAQAITADGSGNIYFVQSGFSSNSVLKIPAGSNTATWLAGAAHIGSIHCDPAGNVYYNAGGIIMMIPAAGGTPAAVYSGINVNDFTIDAAGNLFYIPSSQYSITELKAGSSTPVQLVAGALPPMSADATGRVTYMQTYAKTSMARVSPSGGYAVISPLPPGLNFDSATGIISGTPTTGSPATNYTLSASNASGSTQATLNIKVISNDATLKNQTISLGRLSPAFASATISYTDTVAYTNTTITLTPTVNYPNSTVKINGSTVASGSASGAIALNVGSNTINTVVTAENGTTTKTYTTTVYRILPATNTRLSGLAISAGTLSPAFATATLNYTASTKLSSINITPALADPNATVTINGTAVTSGASSAVALNEGSNLILIVVTAQDGSTKGTYSITVTRLKSPDATLLSLVPGTGSIFFNKTITSYTMTVANTAATITFKPSASYAAATVTVAGQPVASGTPSQPINLAYGSNTITVEVTAEDGTINDYTVIVTRKPADDADLSALTISAGALSPAFAENTLNYTAQVGYGFSSVTFLPTTKYSGSYVYVNGTFFYALFGPQPIPLQVGANVVNVQVYSYDFIDQANYQVTVTRLPAPDLSLSTAAVNTGTLTTATANNTTAYTATLDYTATSVDLTLAATNPAATVSVIDSLSGLQINGAPFSIPLGSGNSVTVGDTIKTFLTVAVSADNGNGQTTVTYPFTIIQVPSTDATLSGIGTSSGLLNPVFDPATLNYAVAVGPPVRSIMLTPSANGPGSVISVSYNNGSPVSQTVASGSATSSIPLSVGDNIITTQVTAQDGATIKTYTTTFTRAAGSPNADLGSLSITNNSISPLFDPAVTAYTATMTGYPLATLNLVTADTAARISVNGTDVPVGINYSNQPLVTGTNAFTIAVTAQDGTIKTYTLTIQYAPSPDASLSDLTTSDGGFDQTFDTNVFVYTKSVPYELQFMAFKANTTQGEATMTLNGAPMLNNTQTSGFPLVLGDNVYQLVVTSQDGSSSQTYLITVTRQKSTDAYLNIISLTGATLDIPYEAANTSFTAHVPNSTSSITVSAETESPVATIRINGTVVASDVQSAPIPLVAGDNVITVNVTAQDGVTVFNNTVTVTRAPSPNDQLTGLSISQGTLSPAFDPSVTNYNVAVGDNVNFLTLTPTTAEPNAVVTITDDFLNYTTSSGTASQLLMLTGGDNIITVKVTAQDGTTSQTFTVDVYRTPSDAALSSLAISAGALSPVFDPATTTYSVSVDYPVSSLIVTPVTHDPLSTVTVNGGRALAAGASKSVKLKAGANSFVVVVRSHDQTNLVPYFINVNRALPSTNDNLANLAISAGTLSHAYDPGVSSYTASVGSGTGFITVTPTVTDATSTITVNDSTVTSGLASGAVALQAGQNTITVVITAQDGVTSQSYTITVTRAASANAQLASLNLSGITLSPSFDPGTGSYTASVANSVSSVSVTPVTLYASSTVKVNGSTVTSGTASAAIPLNVGDNTITTQVKAEDGTTTQSYTAIVTRAPSANAGLISLGHSAGTLSPAFAQATTSYIMTVAHSVTSITLTPLSADNTSTIKVNGAPVSSGTASGAIMLNVGQNNIAVVVTAQDGITTQTYNITVTRAGLINAYLTSLKISGVALTPVFNYLTYSYAVSEPNSVTSVTVTPITSDTSATISINGIPVKSKTASQSIQLNPGINTISAVVTAQDGVTVQLYGVAITRAASTNDGLAAFTTSSGTMAPSFTTANTSYSMLVGYSTGTIAVTPVTSDPNASVTVNGSTVNSGSSSAPVTLSVGTNAINVAVTAQDGTTIKTYTLTVTRAPSINASLASMGPSITPLTPAFVPGTTSYTLNVSNAIASMTVTPVTSDPNATMKVNGATLASGTTSASVPLTAGAATVITTVVTAQDGSTTKTYTLTVNRPLSNDASLSALQLSAGTLQRAFTPGYTTYTANVSNVTSAISITPTATTTNALITVNGSPATSGAVFGPVALNLGSNTITVKVTAQDGITTKTYTVTVTRALSANDNLGTLGSSVAGLTPAFAAATTDYSLNVGASTSSMTIKPVTSQANATMTINGTPATSGVTFGPIALAVGSNTIAVKVTAQDGITSKTYTVTVTRASAGADSYGPGISVTKPVETPQLAEDGIIVHQGISPNGDGLNDFLQIDNISQYPENKLTIMNRSGQLIYEAKNYDNSAKAFDGHSNKTGQMQLPGTYFYQLDYTVNGITKHKTGFLVLKY